MASTTTSNTSIADSTNTTSNCTQCQFYIQKRKRHCKFLSLEGWTFCAEHLPRDLSSGEYRLNGKRRIPCPLDPKHTVFEAKLQSHLKKCNSKPVDPGPFFVKDINSGEGVEPDFRLLADVPKEELDNVIRKIETLYDRYVDIKTSIQVHKALQSALENPEHQSCLKHRKQEASLLGNMDRMGWIVDETIYVEFGAGRARLASYLIEAASSQANSHFILVDRDHARNKCENVFKGCTAGPSFERLRIDIKDLLLAEHQAFRETRRPVVAYSKHLCGCATDLTLRCLESCNSDREPTNTTTFEKRAKLSRVKGIQIALCCHHRCTWSMYYGKEFWIENGLSPDDFVIARALTGWATCAFSSKTTEHTNSHPIPQKETEPDDRYEGLDREAIGIKSKRILDYGRMAALTKLGYNTQLVTYIPRDVSLENVMLIASPSPLSI